MNYTIECFFRFVALIIIISFSTVYQGCKKATELPAEPEPAIARPIEGLAEVLTDSISALSNFSVTFKGKIIDQGASAIIESGIVVDTIANPTVAKNLNKFKLAADANGEMKVIVTYVPEGTTFYLRSYAVNSAGTAYGNQVSFRSPEGKSTLEIFDITTQQQLIALGEKHYTSVQGLRISGTVSDLRPLKDLSFVTGGMQITNTSLLKDLTGLEHLEMVGSIFPNSLRLDNNHGLTSLRGLNGLKMVRGYFYIINHPLLSDLKGLDNYTTTSDGEFRVDNCSKLRSLEGIENMQLCLGGLAIIKNPLLQDLKPLANVRVCSAIIISNNAELKNIFGLEGLREVDAGAGEFGHITIQSNPMLNSLEGLKNINRCASVNITLNASLQRLNGLDGLSQIDYLRIEGNGSLIDFKGLNELRTVNKNLKISQNDKLENMVGLEKLEKVTRLEIILNKGIKNLIGLNGLKSIGDSNGYAVTIGLNENLISLSGLEQLASSGDGIQINYNKNLADFCPLKLLMSSYKGSFFATDNKVKMDEKILVSSCK